MCLCDNQNNIHVHTTQSIFYRWTEMDPLYVLETVVNGIEIVAQQLIDKNISIKQVKCTPISYYSFFSSIFKKVLSYFSEFYVIFSPYIYVICEIVFTVCFVHRFRNHKPDADLSVLEQKNRQTFLQRYW